MNNINKWLEQFTSAWKNHNIDNVLSLFTQNVEYWETPFIKIRNLTSLRKEWEYINSQRNIDISCEVFSKIDNKYTVKWSLGYLNKDNIIKNSRGVYLITLNQNNLCTYFFHCGEFEK
ncbi:MAG: hypothetical protein Q7T50_02335 [Candidatus Magasanikbacteria bacterium]|nr:hypothetical protein [Candidatus Magasanikbacteria bacterium]